MIEVIVVRSAGADTSNTSSDICQQRPFSWEDWNSSQQNWRPV